MKPRLEPPTGLPLPRDPAAILVLDGGIQIRGDAAEISKRVRISAPDAARRMTITIVTEKLEMR